MATSPFLEIAEDILSDMPGKSGHVDDMQSVHSRNTVLLGDLIPSQYYGSCVKQ